MKIKTTMLAVLLALAPVAVRAQDIDSYDNYRVGCSAAVCNDFEVNYREDEVAQRTRNRRTRRTRRTDDSKYYAGGNLGIFLPGDDLDVGFGLGGLFGYKFSENVSAELELYDYFGGSEFDDLGYNVLGVAANGVYRYYFGSDTSESLYAFGGVGLGFGVVSATGDVADDLDDRGVDTSETGFLFQGKVGVGYPLNDKIDIFGQSRYVNISNDSDFEGDDGGDAFAFDLGATYKF